MVFNSVFDYDSKRNSHVGDYCAFEKSMLSVGLNILLVIPGVLIANTPLWIVYPYCYSGYMVSRSLHAVTSTGLGNGFNLMPFLPCAIAISVFVFLIAITQFGKKEMR